LVFVGVKWKGHQVGSGDHYLAGHGLFKIEDTFDHFPLFFVDQATLFTLVDDFLEFSRASLKPQLSF
jgi:hypothetical protein